MSRSRPSFSIAFCGADLLATERGWAEASGMAGIVRAL
jgi:hypothetical protein